jgi:hypothetical protein
MAIFFAVIPDFAVADRDHFSLGRFLLGRIRNNDAPLGRFFLLYTLNQNSILQWSEFHDSTSPFS